MGIFKPNKKYDDEYGLATSVTRSPLPHNSVATLSDPNWKMAMDDEYDALIKNKTWELVLVHLILMLFGLCGFLLIKKNLTVCLRGTKPVL